MIWIILVIVTVLFVIALMIYKLPSDQASKRHKKEKKVPVTAPVVHEKDWNAIAVRWEKKNALLQAEIDKLTVEHKGYQREIEDQKQIVKDLNDKIILEKSWREKEQGNLEKSRLFEKDLKAQMIKTESELEREHSLRMSIERELQEIKIKFEALQEEKRQATVNAGSLSVTVKDLQVQVRDLMRTNKDLKYKREDVQWVAKSEHDELMAKYRNLLDESAKAQGSRNVL